MQISSELHESRPVDWDAVIFLRYTMDRFPFANTHIRNVIHGVARRLRNRANIFDSATSFVAGKFFLTQRREGTKKEDISRCF